MVLVISHAVTCKSFVAALFLDNNVVLDNNVLLPLRVGLLRRESGEPEDLR